MSRYSETITLGAMGAMPIQTDGGFDYGSPTLPDGAYQENPPAPPVVRAKTPAQVAAEASASAPALETKGDAVVQADFQGDATKDDTPTEGGSKSAMTKYLPYAIGFGLIYFLFLRKK